MGTRDWQSHSPESLGWASFRMVTQSWEERGTESVLLSALCE